jgi:hypothetical protein
MESLIGEPIHTCKEGVSNMIARMFGIGRNHQFGGLQQELKEFQCKFPAGYRVPDLMDDTTDGSMTMTSEAKQSCLALEHPEICASPSQGVGGLGFSLQCMVGS